MWNSPAEFFAMGGYALYVWSSFGVCLIILLLEPLLVRARYRAIVHRLKQEQLAEQFDLLRLNFNVGQSYQGTAAVNGTHAPSYLKVFYLYNNFLTITPGTGIMRTEM